MINTKIIAFMRQPSTVLGLSALIGTFTAYLTGEITWQGAVPAIAGALAAVVLPDDSGAQVAIKDAATAVVVAEQATVRPASKAVVAVGVAKVSATIMLLMATSFGLSACAVQPAIQARGAVRATETAYIASLDADAAITAHLTTRGETAHAALVDYAIEPNNDAQAQVAEMIVAMLAAYGAAQVIR